MNTSLSTRPGQGLPKRGLFAITLLILLGAIAVAVYLQYSAAHPRPLTDAQISAFLHDDADPDGIVYALHQVQGRVSRGERIEGWVPELIRLSTHPAEEVRHTVADLMAQDPVRPEFHRILLSMLGSDTVLVRNSAALSLAAFGDGSGREQIASMLEPSTVTSPRPGHVRAIADAGGHVTHGAVILHLQSGNTEFSVLSPVDGRIRSLAVQDGDMVSGGTRLAVVEPGPAEVLAALQALQKVGKPQDIAVIMPLESNPQLPSQVREAAKLTEDKIKQRAE